jgi:CheY-like chemotaxis protein
MAAPRVILILDDEPERIRAMRTCLSDGVPGYSVVTFDNAPDAIGWLAKRLEEANLICLRTMTWDRTDPATEKCSTLVPGAT